MLKKGKVIKFLLEYHETLNVEDFFDGVRERIWGLERGA